jgi:Cu-Zn family superoxide dismutase
MSWFLTHRSASYIKRLYGKKPDAKADIRGSGAYRDIVGTAEFYQTGDGVLVSVEVTGLPSQPGPCASGIFALHLHEGAPCAGTPDDPYADVGGHYNPGGCPHPHHAGDLPPLFETEGRAFMVVLTGRFKVADIIGRTVIIHAGPDDFTSQPAGSAGRKIACGVIRR